MKKVQLLTLVLGFAAAASGVAKGFNVKIENTLNETEKSFSLQVATTMFHSSMCGLVLTDMHITQSLALLDQEIAPVADLNLTFRTNPRGMCLMAIGPHRGGVNFNIGEDLPNLSGLYNLVINGENYGILRIGAEEGAILDAEVENN